MAYKIYSSAEFQANVGLEQSFNAGATGGTNYGALGVGMKVSTFDMDADYDPLYQLAQRNPVEFYTKGHKVNTDLDFVLAADNYNWINLLGLSTVTGQVSDTMSTAFVQVGGPTNVYTVGGVAFSSAAIDVEETKTIDVKMTGRGASLSVAAGSLSTTYPVDPLIWTTASVTLNGGAVSNPVKKASINIKNDLGQYYGLGSDTYTMFTPLKFTVTADIEIYHTSGLVQTILTQPDAATSTNTLVLSVAPYTFTISGVRFNKGGFTLQPVDPVIDKLSVVGTAINITA
mgnify:CR=1 FL=1